MPKERVQIFCINCLKLSGHYEDDLIRTGVKKPVKCKNCGHIVADAPDIDKNNINFNSTNPKKH